MNTGNERRRRAVREPITLHGRAAAHGPIAFDWQTSVQRIGYPLLAAERLPLLVTGVSGVSGFNIFCFLCDKYPGWVIGQRPARGRAPGGTHVVGLDLDDRDGLRQLVRKHRFRSVLHCGGNCALKSCQLDPAMAWRLNVAGLSAVLDAIEALPCRLVHLSIDLVFSGRREGNYGENDAIDPVTVYGETMAAAESLVLQRRPDACILRISLPMGISVNGHAGAIDWIQSRFIAGHAATLYFDEVRTPTYVECLSEVCEEVLARDASGIFHAGGPRAISLYQIAQVVSRVGGCDPDLLRGCYRIQAGPIPPRAGNVSMDSSKLTRLLGRAPFSAWPALDWLVPTDRDWHRAKTRLAVSGSRALIADWLYRRPVTAISPRAPGIDSP